MLLCICRHRETWHDAIGMESRVEMRFHLSKECKRCICNVLRFHMFNSLSLTLSLRLCYAFDWKIHWRRTTLPIKFSFQKSFMHYDVDDDDDDYMVFTLAPIEIEIFFYCFPFTSRRLSTPYTDSEAYGCQTWRAHAISLATVFQQ